MLVILYFIIQGNINQTAPSQELTDKFVEIMETGSPVARFSCEEAEVCTVALRWENQTKWRAEIQFTQLQMICNNYTL